MPFKLEKTNETPKKSSWWMAEYKQRLTSSTTRGIILENFRRNLKVRGSLCVNKRCANHSSCLAWHPGLYRESGTCVLLWYWQTW